MLKLYLYGYLNQIRSSRNLERESARNIELLWLLNRLAPDFKTIANFRRENGVAFAAVCRAFVCFCRSERLIAGELVAIDGSKFKAVASKRQGVSQSTLVRQVARMDAEIAAYLEELERSDRSEAGAADPALLQGTLAKLREQRAGVAMAAQLMVEMDAAHHVMGEADARLMRMNDGSKHVAYNVQTAVDGEHGLIVHHAVTQDAGDNRQLQPMAEAAKAVLDQAELKIVADAGYSNAQQLAQCEVAGITPIVPPNRATNNQGDGMLFDKRAFVFDAEHDRYLCPASQSLTRKQINNNERVVVYTTTACSGCALRPQCTAAKQCFLQRSFDEGALERAQGRCDADPDAMKRRRCIVEHPFGNLKTHFFGTPRFLLRGLHGAAAEMNLAGLAHNFKRVANILGTRAMAAAIAR